MAMPPESGLWPSGVEPSRKLTVPVAPFYEHFLKKESYNRLITSGMRTPMPGRGTYLPFEMPLLVVECPTMRSCSRSSCPLYRPAIPQRGGRYPVSASMTKLYGKRYIDREPGNLRLAWRRSSRRGL